MWQWTLRAPAKINRFLYIGPPRPDGYHPIISLFETIDIYDRITISCLKQTGPFQWRGQANHPDLGDLRNSTIGKGLDLLAQRATLQGTWYIEVDKRIPIGSGLGGGSSDVANVLIFFNRLLALNLAHRDLIELARSVGADVPYFLYGGRALVTGIGDSVIPLPDPPRSHEIILVIPKDRALTHEMYRELDRQQIWHHPMPEIRQLLSDEVSLHKLYTQAVNTFEPVLGDRLPWWEGLKQALGHRATLQWSGSGTAFWVIPRSQTEMQTILKTISDICPSVQRIEKASFHSRKRYWARFTPIYLDKIRNHS